jgi:hypothetical protein
MSATNTDLATIDEAIASLTNYFPEVDQADLNSVVTFDEAIAAAGLSEEQMVVVTNPYTVLNKDKDVLVDQPFFVKLIRFTKDAETDNPFAILYVVDRANQMFVVTDGSTGIFRQALAIVAQRVKDGHPTPFQNWMIVNGLRKSEYKLGVDNKPLTKEDIANGVKASSTGVTYYFA